MQLVFIRHAESINNYEYFKHRSNEGRLLDPPLSELGAKQALELRDFLAEHKEEFNFDRIYISPFLRTLQTADAFAHLYPDIPKQVWMWIHEGGGCFEIESEEPRITVGMPGLTRSQMMEQFPQFTPTEEITEQGWYFLPGVEPYSHRFYRANYVVEKLVERYGDTDEMIALVSHGGFHNHFTSAIMKMTKQPGLWMEIENTGISSFGLGRTHEGDHPQWRIDYMNRHEWLHGKDLTRNWRVYS